MKGKNLNHNRKPFRTHYWRYMSYIYEQMGIEMFVVQIDFMTGKILYTNKKGWKNASG